MNKTLKRALSGAVYVTIMWFGTSYSELSFHILFSGILIVCLYEMWKLRKGNTKVLAFLYVLIPFITIYYLPNVRSNNNEVLIFDPSLILFMFILIWTFDTFAFLVGIKFGKNKILASVSPKKSWEGFTGGLLFTVIISYISVNYIVLFENIQNSIIISLILPVTATIGDFIESHFKREAGVKDSGNFIPGHGGMLDRMDAFIITIPVLYLLTNLL